MKVFYLANTIYSPAGMERVLISKANLLAARYGHEVTIVTNHQKGRPTFFPVDPKVRLVDLDVNTHLPWNLPRYLRRLEALIRAEQPDIVDSLCIDELPSLLKLKGLCKVLMAEFHFSHDTLLVKGQRRKLHVLEQAVGGLDCFVVLTKEDREAWAPYCDRLEQIYNPADYTPGELAPLDAKRCISGGRFEKQKNYDDMVRVWKKVHERHPDWTLDLYGNGKKKARTEALIRREGLEGAVRVHPATPRFKDEMLASSMYLMTSLYEGFPMVLVETAAIGLPCVCTTCPCGPAEFIRDGVDGMLAAPGDIDGMADKICALIEQPELRRSMGREINKKAADFTPDRILDQWDRLFRRLATSG